MLICDVLVVGLGPAGSCAAAEAAKRGRHVIAVERKVEAGKPVQCAEFVPALIGTEVSAMTGAMIQSISSMETYVEDGGAELTPDFPGRMIDRAEFDRSLAEEAARAGAETNFGVAVRKIGDGGEVTLSDGRVVKPSLIIGADGPRSDVGEAIGVVNREVVESRQICVDLNGAHDATDIWLSSDIPGGYGWLFPKGDKANLGLGVAAEYKDMLKPALEKLHASLVAEGRVGKIIHGWTGGAIPVGGLLKAFGELGETKVLLAGDAAGTTHPVTGAGIASAVISGKLAGEAAHNWLSGDEDAPEDYAEELEDWLGPALTRAVAHRNRLLQMLKTQGHLSPEELRSGWIAYLEYWAA